MTKEDTARQIKALADQGMQESRDCLFYLLGFILLSFGKKEYKGLKERVEAKMEELIRLFNQEIEKETNWREVISKPHRIMTSIPFLLPPEYPKLHKVIMGVYMLATRYKGLSIVANQIAQGAEEAEVLENRFNSIDSEWRILVGDITEFCKAHTEVLQLKDFKTISKHDKLIQQIENLKNKLITGQNSV